MFFIISVLCISIYIGFRVRNFSCLHDILAQLQFGLPGQKRRIIEKNGENFVCNLNISVSILFPL